MIQLKPKFCLYCADPLTQQDETHYTCQNGHDYWNNPVTAAGIIMMKNGLVLYAKRAIEPHKGKYDLPGGFLEHSETADAAAIRELKEELDIVPKNVTLFYNTTHDYVPGKTVNDLLFLCTEWTGKMKPQDDVAALEWKPIDFINSPQFAWNYSGLVTKLKQL